MKPLIRHHGHVLEPGTTFRNLDVTRVRPY